MADKFTRFLKEIGQGIGAGLVNPKGNMGDFRHATRLFLDNGYSLSPRAKFMFHVTFDINKQAILAPQFSQRHMDEVGLMVKSADLPKFSVEQDIKNQYNRKKIINKRITYDPITITFHDDSTGIINAMWALYYGYYFRDRLNAPLAYGQNHYRGKDSPLSAIRYGLDNDSRVPFFNSISIYTLSRKRFNGYQLINPSIQMWDHGNGDYASGGETIESSMTVNYEAVNYTYGDVDFNSPPGFAKLHYDTLPSPLTIAGGGTPSITGAGGILAGAEIIFGAIASGSAFATFNGFLGTAIAAINTYQNVKNITGENIQTEVINILNNPATGDAIASGVNGITGILFPQSTPTTSTTTATPKTF